MIGQDLQAAQTFLHAWDTLTGATGADNPLRDTVTDAEFPGALLAARSPDGLPVFYATAQDARGWHRLAPLLTAFAGLTTTDFRGPPSNALNHQDPLENLITSGGCHAVARLRVAPTTATLAERSLRRLYLVWRQAPRGRQALLESTGTLLSRFHAALATFDAATARALLTQLEQERRLDALNLNFLEIALRSALGDWSGLRALECLPYVLAARRPPAVSVAIAEAVWYCVLAPALESGDIDAAMALYRVEARPFIAVLGNVPRNAAPGVFALMAVAVLAGDLDIEALAERLGETGFDILPPLLAQAVRGTAATCPTTSSGKSAGRSPGGVALGSARRQPGSLSCCAAGCCWSESGGPANSASPVDLPYTVACHLYPDRRCHPLRLGRLDRTPKPARVYPSVCYRRTRGGGMASLGSIE